MVQQTGERSFLLTGNTATLQYNEGGGPVSAAPVGGAPGAAAPIVREESAEPILIDISERTITAEAFKAMATRRSRRAAGLIIARSKTRSRARSPRTAVYRVRILFPAGGDDQNRFRREQAIGVSPG